MVIISSKPIDPSRSHDLIKSADAGSVVFHYAVVKADGGGERPTAHVEYRPYGDVQGELEAIAEKLRRRWNLKDVLLQRRFGSLAVGEIISLVATCSQSSENALGACRDGIDRLKEMKTIVKTEFCVSSAEPA